LPVNPWVESGSTRAPMPALARRPSVCSVSDFFDELTIPRGMRQGGPPRVVYVLRTMGSVGVAVIVFAALSSAPKPGVSGDGLGVLAGLLLFLGGVACSYRRRTLPRGMRFSGLIGVALGGALLAYFQPGGGGLGAVYFVFAMAELRLPRRPAAVICIFALAVQSVAIVVAGVHVGDNLATLFFGTLPWFFVLRLMRELRMRGEQAECLVEELRESREAEAEAAKLGERARVARDLHDVLAHSLSALALQLEAARLLARDRGADGEVVRAIETAHRLAANGLDEARRSISALRGDELPGPERLGALAETFGDRVSFSVTGEPHELGSEARIAVYRTAQEALTNVRRHSAADSVEISLDYDAEGTTLVVADHGPGAPVLAVGTPPRGSGYGLTGMRERAELLGGRLSAGPTDDGFRVELWLPA
jgi:signal transduction histidine kinase